MDRIEMQEIWKSVDGYDGLYQISNYGRIKSNYFGRTQLLKLHDIKGYLCVYLFDKNHNKQKWYVHRLVALHFLLNPNNLPEVNHKDENKQNNYVGNLEWCDKKYNANYGSRNYKISLNNVSRRKVNQYDLNGNYIRTYDTIKEACELLGIRSSGISNCCANRLRTSGGFIWKYFEER